MFRVDWAKTVAQCARYLVRWMCQSYTSRLIQYLQVYTYISTKHPAYSAIVRVFSIRWNIARESGGVQPTMSIARPFLVLALRVQLRKSYNMW